MKTTAYVQLQTPAIATATPMEQGARIPEVGVVVIVILVADDARWWWHISIE